MSREIVRRRGVEERLERLNVSKIDLLQFHWWTFEHPAWLDALHEMQAMKDEGLIGALGLTNVDAAHLALAVADGIEIVSNQVSFSLIDRRAAGDLSRVCARSGVKLLAYGTLCGGFLSEKWLGKTEPTEIADWSRSKYKRFNRRRRRLGALSGDPPRRRRHRPQAQCLALECRQPLGAGA